MAADPVDDRGLAAVRGQVQLRSCGVQLPGGQCEQLAVDSVDVRHCSS